MSVRLEQTRRPATRPAPHPAASKKGTAPRRTRTYNPLIKSQLLCQLS